MYLVCAACWYQYSLPYLLVNTVTLNITHSPQFLPQSIGDEDLLAMDWVIYLLFRKHVAEKLPDLLTVLCTKEVPNGTTPFAIGEGLGMHEDIQSVRHVHM
jgi:hypothetical protein